MVFIFLKNLIELSRRDDLESLMYLLTYLAQGFLPWLSVMSNNIIVSTSLVKDQKMKIKGEELCKDLPSILFLFNNLEPFAMLFNYARNLDIEQKPDYGYMKKGLKSVLDSIVGTLCKPIFDWH